MQEARGAVGVKKGTEPEYPVGVWHETNGDQVKSDPQLYNEQCVKIGPVSEPVAVQAKGPVIVAYLPRTFVRKLCTKETLQFGTRGDLDA